VNYSDDDVYIVRSFVTHSGVKIYVIWYCHVQWILRLWDLICLTLKSPQNCLRRLWC